jgi:diacylglycerol kinase (ATP)
VPRSFSLIVNPAAGGGRALQVLPEVTAELDALGLGYQVSQSASLRHARELALAAGQAGHVVVAVGGDGMAGALAGAAAAASATFAIIPAGRGNDLARVLAIPAAPRAAAGLLARGRTRQVDLISVTTPGQPECVVAGSVYTGLPSVAGEIANATRWLTGPAVYPVSALRVLATWRPVRFQLAPPAGSGDRPGAATPQDFPGYAVVVANSAYFGAGMMVAPPARLDDGVLDIVAMHHGSRLAFIRVLLKIKTGAHVALAQIGLDRGPAVTLTMDRPMPVAADGETLPWAGPLPAGAPLTVRALPGALTVLVPPDPAPTTAPAGRG